MLKSTLAVTALSIAATGAQAAGAVAPNVLSTGVLNNAVTSLTKTFANTDVQSYTSNPTLDSAGWGHQGSFYTFHTHMSKNYSVTATASGDITPGITVWRTDGAFDGGTAPGTGELSTASKGVPHSFNQVGQAGDWGLLWATDDSISSTFSAAPGNTASGILSRVGYANDGSTQALNGWGATVNSDGNADGLATVNFTSLMHGDYLIFVGGADGTNSGGTITLNVSQVPVPAAAYLFGTALFGLFASTRRKQATA